MKNIIIGTAGHVDHGKTTLIKALSGIDTDRLTEEKKRGITIELGFAHIPNDAGYNIGVIDVPGHEKFIKHMLAGVGGIDFVLFVVAADEGIMPQTKEHFEILSALGIDDGIIAVTKTDMVEDDWLEMLTEDIQDYFKGSFLEGKPLIQVSSVTGEGIEQLRSEIIAKCDRENKRREEKELFRLPVDRVFSMQGFGTVVTGTLMDGSVNTGDEVLIFPKMTKAKVRGIQTYGKETETALAGQRTAINLSGVDKSDLDRGDVLARKGAVVATQMLDAELKLFDSADRVVLNGSRVHLYTGSSEILCKVVLLDRDALSAGESAYVQLRTEEPLSIRRGDRFIIRFYSPMLTIGGGRIIDANPAKHKRNREDVIKDLQLMSGGSLDEILLLKAGGNRFIRQDELSEELGVLKTELAGCSERAINKGTLVKLEDDTILSAGRYERLKSETAEIIEAYHAANPLSDGIPRQELLSRLKNNLHTDDDRMVQAFVQHLIDEGFAVNRGKSVALAGFRVEYSEDQLKLKAKIEAAYKDAGTEIIKIEELPSDGEDMKTIRALLEDLIKEAVIVKLSPEYYIDSRAWEHAVSKVSEFTEEFSVAEYRDKLGTSRKYAEELLAAMDRMGITRFDGKIREVIRR